MNRKQYSVDQFIKDEFFQHWVYTPDAESDLYWNNFLKANPHQCKAVEEARLFLLAFFINESDILESRISNLKKRIFSSIGQHPEISGKAGQFEIKPPKHSNFFSLRLAVAACLTLLIAVSVSLFVPLNSLKDVLLHSMQQHITQRGNRSVITLEDGTKVWLNADSRLAYPESFTGKSTREVYLDGEAFFKVTSNQDKPFIVRTSDIKIRVLGTSFNVKSYSNHRNIETTLVEGKVTIEPNKGEAEQLTLLPNQLAVFEKQTRQLLVQKEVNTATYTGWKEGNLNFDKVPVDEIIDALERWFNVTIYISEKASVNCRFSAKVDNKTLEEVLELFHDSAGIRYEIKGKKVFIYGELCNDE